MPFLPPSPNYIPPPEQFFPRQLPTLEDIARLLQSGKPLPPGKQQPNSFGGLLNYGPPEGDANNYTRGLIQSTGDVVPFPGKGLLHTPDLLQQQLNQQQGIPHMGAGAGNVTQFPGVTVNPAPVVRPPGGFPPRPDSLSPLMKPGMPGYNPATDMPSPGAMLARQGLIWQKSSAGRGRDPTHNPEILKQFEALPFTEQMKFSWMIKSAMEAGMDKPKDWTSAPPAMSRQEAIQSQRDNPPTAPSKNAPGFVNWLEKQGVTLHRLKDSEQQSLWKLYKHTFPGD